MLANKPCIAGYRTFFYLINTIKEKLLITTRGITLLFERASDKYTTALIQFYSHPFYAPVPVDRFFQPVQSFIENVNRVR